MKKLLCALLCLMLLALAVPSFAQEERAVATHEELKAALEDDAVSVVTVSGEVKMLEALMIPAGKTLVVPEGAALTLDGPHFIGEPIFLSLVIAEGAALDVAGTLNTESCFDGMMVIANVVLSGGEITLRDTAGTNSYASLYYGGGTVNMPKEGLPADFDMNWRMEDESLKLKDLQDILNLPFITGVAVVIDLTVHSGETLTVPFAKCLDIEGSITIEEGGSLLFQDLTSTTFGFRIVQRDGKIVLSPK